MQITILIFSLFSNFAFAQFEHCNGDLSCYHKTKSAQEEQRIEQQEARDEEFRRDQLLLQKEQLDALKQQNEILEENAIRSNDQK